MSLTDTASTGDRRKALESLRDRLALDIDNCRSGRDLAALSQRYMDVLAQLESLSRGRPEQVTGLSEFQRRLAAREGRNRSA